MLLNALDYPTVQAVFDAAADGDRIYFPAIWPFRTYYAPNGGIQVTKSLEVFGDGPGDTGAYTGTVFQTQRNDDDVFVIAPPASGSIASLYLHDFEIKTPYYPRHGISCVLAADQSVKALRIERVNALLPSNGEPMTGDGFHFEGLDPAGDTIEMLAMVDCNARLCDGWGALLKNVRSARLTRCGFDDDHLGGLQCDGSGVALYNTSLANQNPGATGTDQALFTGCRIVRVDAGHFEDFNTGSLEVGCRIVNCGGAAVVGGCILAVADPNTDPPTPPDDSTGIEIEGAGPVVLLCNRHTRVKPTLIDVMAGVTDLVLLPQYNNPRANAGNVEGEISLPSGTGNDGLLAMPFVCRDTPPPSISSSSGLALPAGSSDPTAGVQDGMLYYWTSGNLLRVRVGGTWKTVQVL